MKHNQKYSRRYSLKIDTYCKQLLFIIQCWNIKEVFRSKGCLSCLANNLLSSTSNISDFWVLVSETTKHKTNSVFIDLPWSMILLWAFKLCHAVSLKFDSLLSFPTMLHCWIHQFYTLLANPKFAKSIALIGSYQNLQSLSRPSMDFWQGLQITQFWNVLCSLVTKSEIF